MHKEINRDYFASPRLALRYTESRVSGGIYLDCFKAESVTIMREVGGPWNQHGQQQEYGTMFEIRVRCHILQHFLFEWLLY